LRNRSSEFYDYTAIANDPETAGTELRYAWDEVRGMLGGISDKESWIQSGATDLPHHLTPAVNLIRQGLVNPATHTALANNVVFETNLRVIDLVHGAEQFALDGDIALARVCAERARELRLRLGETFEPELSRELDKRLEVIETKQLPPEEETTSTQRETLHIPQPPALASIEQVLSHRARESDVFLLCIKGHAPRMYYTTSTGVPWEDQLLIARIEDNLKFAILARNSSAPVLFYVRKGLDRLSSITPMLAEGILPIDDYNKAMISSLLFSKGKNIGHLALFELR
jgi:hypothetical protein